ncbi:HNH endonuclease signature motif containing protein [Arthrobacter sp. S39]|uniref:HNH endonuclease signature motif containing protein n=1 Tax=Arthrobacter sp. S39 TaxID=2509720 RepID=UPI0010381000|nr:HNH endonuclease signature motif containing protein [Arthrobacter sp. S39]TAP39519.1 HNH endonuclease [Arthrobacter sp. S39]
MESGEGVDSVDAMVAAMAALAVLVERSEGGSDATSSNPLRDQADACLDGLELTARLDAMLAARKVHFAAGYAAKSAALAPPAQSPGQHTAQEMGVVAEVACAMTVSEGTASAFLAQSCELTTNLPLTVEALEKGSMSWQHARAMVDETASLNHEGAAALEAHFLDPNAPDAARRCPAGDMVPSRFRAKARAWRERHHPESIEKRHARGFLDRRLEYAPDRDGMAWLSAYLPADQAAGIWNRTTAAARALQGPAEDRTLPQLRADVVAKLLLSAGFMLGSTADRTTDAAANKSNDGTITGFSDGTTASANDGGASNVPAVDATAGNVDAGRVPYPTAQVLVTVPIFSLMGLTDEPADLDGYGPIPASMARKLVADGASSFRRVLIDPRDGAPLGIGRENYRIPAAMRQWLRMRDGRCSFPGCNNQSLDNDADHILAWADGGTTGITNLESLCRKHHRLKHTTAWTPTGAGIHKPPGWTSPTGRDYPSEHHDWEPPQWPTQILEELRCKGHGAVLSNWPPGDDELEDRPPTDTLSEVLPPEDTPRAELAPDDPSRECAWLRHALEELERLPQLSVTDFLWLVEQPFPRRSAR